MEEHEKGPETYISHGPKAQELHEQFEEEQRRVMEQADLQQPPAGAGQQADSGSGLGKMIPFIILLVVIIIVIAAVLLF